MSRQLSLLQKKYEQEQTEDELKQLTRVLRWRKQELEIVKASLAEHQALRQRLELQIQTQATYLQRAYDIKTMKDQSNDILNEIQSSLFGIDVMSQAKVIFEDRWRPTLLQRGYSNEQIDQLFSQVQISKPRPI